MSYNSWCSGSRIMPLSYDEAKKWAEGNLSVEEYESAFGEVSEGDGKSNMTYHLSEDIIAEIAKISAKLQISKSRVIEKAVRLLAKAEAEKQR